ncbi:MAG: GNAT family N-acetyltransferase [Promethearchaeia archaeon]
MNIDDKKIDIKIANIDNLIDFKLIAKDFIDFIKDFKEKFLNDRFFILSAYYNNILIGILIAEDVTKKIDSLNKILPTMQIYLIYINPNFRKKNIGKKLLEKFKDLQKERGIARIIVKLPVMYKKGIQFFLKNNFSQIKKTNNKIILEIDLWNDYGIKNCDIIDEEFEFGGTFDI